MEGKRDKQGDPREKDENRGKRKSKNSAERTEPSNSGVVFRDPLAKGRRRWEENESSGLVWPPSLGGRGLGDPLASPEPFQTGQEENEREEVEKGRRTPEELECRRGEGL